MNITKTLVLAGALFVSGVITQQAAAAGSSDPGQAFVDRLAGVASTSVTHARPFSTPIAAPNGDRRSHLNAKDFDGFYDAAAGESQDPFYRTQGLGLAEMAGFGSLN